MNKCDGSAVQFCRVQFRSHSSDRAELFAAMLASLVFELFIILPFGNKNTFWLSVFFNFG